MIVSFFDLTITFSLCFSKSCWPTWLFQRSHHTWKKVSTPKGKKERWRPWGSTTLPLHSTRKYILQNEMTTLCTYWEKHCWVLFDPLDLEVPVTFAAFAPEFRLCHEAVSNARARWPQVGAWLRAVWESASAAPWQLVIVAAIRFAVVADMPSLLTH